ncbi:MAG: hypothetical protein J0665_18255 [Deltaproteobacteria bacterium]|nr:hypothetical protein [Deltaproteobacteria bacterium]
MVNYYFSLQYSAIQKTVLRHDRLWSIAGISNTLAKLNEIDLPTIAGEHDGVAIVAGGGKFTARFQDEDKAEAARKACEKCLATTLPMLEFQISNTIWPGISFNTLAKEGNPAIEELKEQKRSFRGYALSFNPHLKLCEECGEYPAQKKIVRLEDEKNDCRIAKLKEKSDNKVNRKESVKDVCRICHAAFEESKKIFHTQKAETTLQKIYQGYIDAVPPSAKRNMPPADFKDLFPDTPDERKRMAVWFSDLNNMNDKVQVWLKQENEDNVLKTFDEFRSTVVDIIVSALVRTFNKPVGKYLPFRLVVAGGDDLCLVMAEKKILNFTQNISAALNEVVADLEENNPVHPLTEQGLRILSKEESYSPKPFGFGGSFVVTSIHTPFSLIHQVGEELMSKAKKETERQGNSVNWRVMAEETSVTDDLLSFERPLFIEKTDRDKDPHGRLSFNDYLALRNTYNEISGSHMQQIVAIMQQEKNPHELDHHLKLLDANEADKSFSPLLRDEKFRDAEGVLMPERIATLFELLTIGGGEE